MEFTDLQMTLTVVAFLTLAAMVVFLDYLRRQPAPQQPQRIKALETALPQASIRIFDATPIDYEPAKKLAAERPLEPLVATATPRRPLVQPRMEGETVTVQMALPSPAAPSGSTEKPTPAVPPTLPPTPFPLPLAALPPVTIDAVLWEQLVASQPRQNLLSPAASIARGSLNTVEAAQRMIHDDGRDVAPAMHYSGMIQQPVLERLLESEEPFTGLVVSIGINDSDSSMWHRQGWMQSVGTYITTLLTENDFSCRTAYDEFVVVCPGERGAQAQRHLNRISERLWDYQLRGTGASSILFSWGGLQIQDQPLVDAVASATERMRETKRRGHSARPAPAHQEAI